MWGSDYPHPDSLWPASHSVLAENLAAFSPSVRRKIVCDNAARLYRPELATARLKRARRTRHGLARSGHLVQPMPRGMAGSCPAIMAGTTVSSYPGFIGGSNVRRVQPQFVNPHVPQTKIRRRRLDRCNRAIAEQLLQARAFEYAVRAAQRQSHACDAAGGLAHYVFRAVERRRCFRRRSLGIAEPGGPIRDQPRRFQIDAQLRHVTAHIRMICQRLRVALRLTRPASRSASRHTPRSRHRDRPRYRNPRTSSGNRAETA